MVKVLKEVEILSKEPFKNIDGGCYNQHHQIIEENGVFVVQSSWYDGSIFHDQGLESRAFDSLEKAEEYFAELTA